MSLYQDEKKFWVDAGKKIAAARVAAITNLKDLLNGKMM